MVQFGSGSERIQPERLLGVLAGWKGDVQLGRGELHTPCRAAAGPSAAGCAASAVPAACTATGQGTRGSLSSRGFSHAGATGRYPHMGENRAPGSKRAAALCRGASHWQGPLAFPTCLGAPLGLQAGARTRVCVAGSPGWPERDRTVLWPPPARSFCGMAAAGAVSCGTRACPCACQPAG